VVEITDGHALDADFANCSRYAQNYKPGFDYAQVGSAAITGAFQQMPALAIAPPLLMGMGALQGAATATINGMDLIPATHQSVLVQCLRAKGQQSGKYLVLDPKG